MVHIQALLMRVNSLPFSPVRKTHFLQAEKFPCGKLLPLSFLLAHSSSSLIAESSNLSEAARQNGEKTHFSPDTFICSGEEKGHHRVSERTEVCQGCYFAALTGEEEKKLSLA